MLGATAAAAMASTVMNNISMSRMYPCSLLRFIRDGILECMREEGFLSLGEWNTLPIIIQHIFHFNCHRRDAQNFVAAVDNVALGRNKHVIALRQEDSLRLTRLIRKPKKLQRNRWRRWRPLRNRWRDIDRKSTRLNSSHANISY